VIAPFVTAMAVLAAATSFAQAESPRLPNPPPAPPGIRYEVRPVVAQEPVSPSPAGGAANGVNAVPPSAEGIFVTPIKDLTADISVKERPAMSANLKRRGEISYVMRQPICYMWDAPATCNNPFYFEDANLERHGYSLRYLRMFQPVVSGAEFFATIPTLPYQMTATLPWEQVYTLGEYRPGSCVPYQINYPPWSAAGGLAEAGTAVGLIFLIP
jgi:hypothetical protein